MKKSKIFTIFFVTWTILGGSLCLISRETKSIDPIFYLKAISHNEGFGPIYLNYVKTYLEHIGINLDIHLLNWSTFIDELTLYRDFDICYVGFTGSQRDPDFTGVYNENGSLNMFGYHTSMDWDDDMGTGINEWYMREGALIIPPDSEERVQHYWAWQQYLMDRIVPCIPIFTKTDFAISYINLDEFSAEDGILQSWGKMDWLASIPGKTDYSEIISNSDYWHDFNPLNQTDTVSQYISNFVLDPLIYYDADFTIWPHLAKNWVFLNDTHMRITLRDGIKWQPDPDGNFTNEIFDVHDVYFSLYCYKLANWFSWLEDFEIVGSTTIDLFIDANPNTTINEPSATFFQDLNMRILPEHFLNQTQLADGVTPNSTHISWLKFNKHGFGTGLFQLKSSNEDQETVLEIFNDSWFLDPLITNDPSLNFDARFGDFSNDLTTLKFKNYSDFNQTIADFNIGKLDILNLGSQIDLVLDYVGNPYYNIGKIKDNTYEFLGFNMREVRPVIGSREAAPGDTTRSKGLFVRKAIGYAIDWEFIGGEIYSNMYERNHNPIYPYLGIWNNPNIIRYNYDYSKAVEYMTKAGFDLGWEPTYDDWNCGGFIAFIVFLIASPFIVVGLVIGLVVFIVVRSNKKKNEKIYTETPVIMKTPADPLEKKIEEITIMRKIEEEKVEKEKINGENE
ncbi:MAG: hypothetical protein KGD59_11700 [Candidatus Heimdallarchaeota archaeon]|nr:hypothetical protein [Candidatus Heimdallarchaeota archaeon]MBY8995208.1 hypothetical protein [Candidatus Heimdallarchaeota archaeon]